MQAVLAVRDQLELRVSERVALDFALPFLFYKLTPGVLNANNYGGGDPQGAAEATDIIVNGARNVSEAAVDGSANMGQRNLVFSPPKDLVQEIRIQTAGYDAAIGHAAGALTNVSTKSGTNEVHGTLYYQDSRWAAVPWATNNYVYNPTTGPIDSCEPARRLFLLPLLADPRGKEDERRRDIPVVLDLLQVHGGDLLPQRGG